MKSCGVWNYKKTERNLYIDGREMVEKKDISKRIYSFLEFLLLCPPFFHGCRSHPFLDSQHSVFIFSLCQGPCPPSSDETRTFTPTPTSSDPSWHWRPWLPSYDRRLCHSDTTIFYLSAPYELSSSPLPVSVPPYSFSTEVSSFSKICPLLPRRNTWFSSLGLLQLRSLCFRSPKSINRDLLYPLHIPP